MALMPDTSSRSEKRPSRAVINNIAPEVDGGRFPAKAILGDRVTVEVDAFVDGHDRVACELRYRHVESNEPWKSVAMAALGNDRFAGWIELQQLGLYEFAVRARVDVFRSWLDDLLARLEASLDVASSCAIGSSIVADAARRARGSDRAELEDLAVALSQGNVARERVVDERFATMAGRYVAASSWTTSEHRVLRVERDIARCSAWYELFPRSTAPIEGRGGRLSDVEARLGYVAQMGFDILYLPPIHPIGTSARKGRGGASVAGPNDPGSPWAIGAATGGHTAVHPDLGTLDDFDHLVAAAQRVGVEIALDLAFQCSPDHPWVTDHPEWFRHRPDGSIAYAENPPKRYEDIYPLDFDTTAWRALWDALLDVVRFWISHGVAVFRVDNPHTKPFAFWRWLIAEVQAERPDVVFLSEAFTRPKVMYHLAKVGFSQSYTYFAWRNSAGELRSYLEELTKEPLRSSFRPNLWTNTPDILTEELQRGPRSAFASRLVLAATLSSSYGIYGPAFELGESAARPDSEEYAASEKYEIRFHDLSDPTSLAPLITAVNAIRREHVALWANDTLRFHDADNPALLVYSKVPSPYITTTGDHSMNPVLVVANLDPLHVQSGWVTFERDLLPPGDSGPVEIEDLLTGATYRWNPGPNFVILEPSRQPAHIFRVGRLGDPR